jgi:hypothetical protein
MHWVVVSNPSLYKKERNGFLELTPKGWTNKE